MRRYRSESVSSRSSEGRGKGRGGRGYYRGSGRLARGGASSRGQAGTGRRRGGMSRGGGGQRGLHRRDSTASERSQMSGASACEGALLRSGNNRTERRGLKETHKFTDMADRNRDDRNRDDRNRDDRNRDDRNRDEQVRDGGGSLLSVNPKYTSDESWFLQSGLLQELPPERARLATNKSDAAHKSDAAQHLGASGSHPDEFDSLYWEWEARNFGQGLDRDSLVLLFRMQSAQYIFRIVEEFLALIKSPTVSLEACQQLVRQLNIGSYQLYQVPTVEMLYGLQRIVYLIVNAMLDRYQSPKFRGDIIYELLHNTLMRYLIINAEAPVFRNSAGDLASGDALNKETLSDAKATLAEDRSEYLNEDRNEYLNEDRDGDRGGERGGDPDDDEGRQCQDGEADRACEERSGDECVKDFRADETVDVVLLSDAVVSDALLTEAIVSESIVSGAIASEALPSVPVQGMDEVAAVPLMDASIPFVDEESVASERARMRGVLNSGALAGHFPRVTREERQSVCDRVLERMPSSALYLTGWFHRRQWDLERDLEVSGLFRSNDFSVTETLDLLKRLENFGRKDESNRVAEEVQKIVENYLGVELRLYGSSATGLATGHSDFDFQMILQDCAKSKKCHKVCRWIDFESVAYANLSLDVSNTTGYVRTVVKALTSHLERKHKEDYTVSAILTAKKPLVSLQHIDTGVNVDICVSLNVVGLCNSALLKNYVKLDSRFAQLAILVKNWSKNRRVNGAYHGHLSSYTITLTVLIFLIKQGVLPNIQMPDDIYCHVLESIRTSVPKKNRDRKQHLEQVSYEAKYGLLQPLEYYQRNFSVTDERLCENPTITFEETPWSNWRSKNTATLPALFSEYIRYMLFGVKWFTEILSPRCAPFPLSKVELLINHNATNHGQYIGPQPLRKKKNSSIIESLDRVPFDNSRITGFLYDNQKLPPTNVYDWFYHHPAHSVAE
ncbi:hypothetical protein GNI_103300 [Gregarina niphandrodes]|uniref:Poly(A) RNA polymerase mitochondrial-like central palm domain-containing protein n=1 Tax=Gregarina niphandrodes TaxID=110365 RepID=A0A023B4K3_GRENI|nr:hypothetical protein GNI_103300 [Gregarina niphandrodes]EZG56499.1 hypothetical protein GNI_103300 [Gregarina niphandrodes]|eukprot:XP_011131238.1 hypothetical protein GNI_103300 [Gregarina niphandrodes]